MPKQRKSKNQLEKDRQKDRERCDIFNKQKADEQARKDTMAREAALKNLGITQDFSFEDHAKIYSFADDSIGAPIQIIDATVAPPVLTSYPEWPYPESPVPELDPVSCPFTCVDPRNEMAEYDARRIAARMCRAKAIFQMNVVESNKHKPVV